MAPRKKVTLNKPVIRPTSQAAAKKPLFSVATLATMVVFAALVLLSVYLSRQAETPDPELAPTIEEVKFLVNETGAVLMSVEIAPGEEGDGVQAKFVRNEQNEWTMELPEKVKADPGALEAAASQISALIVTDTITDAKPADFGFDKPDYVITLKYDNDKEYVVEVGGPNPINTGYYVRVNNGPVQLVELSGLDALTQLAKTPPYLETPTPTVAPTETPQPTATPAVTESAITPTPTP